jgi:hypothetical protein
LKYKINNQDDIVNNIRGKYNNISFFFNERQKRLWAAAESKSFGCGGISAVRIYLGWATESLQDFYKSISPQNVK